jgi:hypothetical protein
VSDRRLSKVSAVVVLFLSIELTLCGEDKVLELHRNVTKVHQQHHKIMVTSLDQVSRIQAKQKSFADGWESFLNRVMGDVEEAQDGVVEKVRMGGTKLERILSGLFDKVMGIHAQSTVTLEKMTEKMNGV